MVWALPPGEPKKLRKDQLDDWENEVWLEGGHASAFQGRPYSLKQAPGFDHTLMVSSAECTTAIIQRRHAERAAYVQGKAKEEWTKKLPRALIKQLEEIDMPLDDKVGCAFESVTKFHSDFKHPNGAAVSGQAEEAENQAREKVPGEPQGVLVHRLNTWSSRLSSCAFATCCPAIT
eukprot:337497-Rhodomonas_salina.2